MNSYDFYTQKKSTFWLHFGSIWGAHVAKTLFFTMNLKDFRGVVFDSQKSLKSGNYLSRWLQVQQSWFQIAQVIAYLFAHMPKRLSTSNLQETKVSLSAIYTYWYIYVRRKSRNGNFIYLQLRPAAAIVVVGALLCCFVVPLFRVVCAVVLWVLWIPYFALFWCCFAVVAVAFVRFVLLFCGFLVSCWLRAFVVLFVCGCAVRFVCFALIRIVLLSLLLRLCCFALCGFVLCGLLCRGLCAFLVSCYSDVILLFLLLLWLSVLDSLCALLAPSMLSWLS